MNDATKRNEERLNELAQLRRENAELKNLLRAPNPGSRLDEHRMLLDTIDTHVFYLSDPSTYGMVNKAHANFFGAQKSDLEYKNIYAILTAQEAEVCIEGNERIFRGKKQIVTEELMKGGRW